MKKILGIFTLIFLFATNTFAASYNCKMVGSQNIPTDKDFDFKSFVNFPKKLQFNLSMINMDGNFENTDAYFDNYRFSIFKYKGFYSVSDKDLKFEIKSLDKPQSINHNIFFFLDYDTLTNTYKNLWVDNYWHGGNGVLNDYDAHYICDKII